MKKTVSYCDRCGKETPLATICATIDRRTTAAGDSEDVAESVDLCPLHARESLAAIVKAMDHSAAERWVRSVVRPSVREAARA